jgi:diaminohydroxyphosphoribosylaminopyrimidine deaminase/5-amino-6-(5-phosphoribosylamino)uracil reductase
MAGKRAKGADLYVNLEPCCHFGRTPPCTEIIIKSGIKRLFFGMKDPNPKVSGNGIKILKKAGIKVTGPLLPDLCRKLNEPFVKWISTGIPYVTAKIAITLDGKIADKNGGSKWISNDASRTYVHWLRAGHDIVMVGSETARKDS